MNTYYDRYEVSSHDVDINNNIRPSIVARIMQETANHHMRDRKPSYYDLFFSGKSFIVTRMAIEMLDDINQYDDLESHTWRCPEKAATFIRCFVLTRDGKPVAKAYSEWAVANRHTGKLCRAKEVDISNYETDEPIEVNNPVKFRFPKGLEFEYCGIKKVMYSDVDMNMHMNNTYYEDMLWNYIPDVQDKKMTSFSLRFMAEAPFEGEIEIYRAKAEETVSDTLGAEETYYFYSKVDGRTNIEAVVSAKKAEKQILEIQGESEEN